MAEHPRYSDVKKQIDFGKDFASPDIVFYRHTKTGKEIVFAEVKIARLFTESRVLQCIQRLHSYLKKEPTAKLAFVTPGDLPRNYVKLIQENHIELWDRAYIAKEFSVQIQSTQPASFKNFFQLEPEEDKFDLLIRRLRGCPAGTSDWGKYQSLVGEVLETICCPPLKPPMPQKNDGAKKNRRDYILANYSREKDTWEFLRDRYDADYIVVDAKNSGKCITKQDVLQIANYLKRNGTGLFGIIIARKGTNSTSDYAIREMWLYEHKMIVVLNDDDLEQMILARKNGADPAELILKKIEYFRLSI